MMTSVLRDSLGGNCKTAMIGNISVETASVEESLATCRFSQRVALIKNDAVVNEELDPNLLIKKLKREVSLLKEELKEAGGEVDEEDLTPEDLEKAINHLKNV